MKPCLVRKGGQPYFILGTQQQRKAVQISTVMTLLVHYIYAVILRLLFPSNGSENILPLYRQSVFLHYLQETVASNLKTVCSTPKTRMMGRNFITHTNTNTHVGNIEGDNTFITLYCMLLRGEMNEKSKGFCENFLWRQKCEEKLKDLQMWIYNCYYFYIPLLVKKWPMALGIQQVVHCCHFHCSWCFDSSFIMYFSRHKCHVLW